MDQIYDWIADKSRDGAERWYLAFRTGCQRIVEAPDSFSLATEFDEGDERAVREFLFKTRRGRTYRGLFILVTMKFAYCVFAVPDSLGRIPHFARQSVLQIGG